ncbi:hypothetical protein CVT26_007846 [Gymnopilus dilepis]|uniref:Uncharacterized protein n=1 Tax=Gymnopilus dilepis TaxID=231916 RepID=A0A409W7T2_9AGAR|nr:hypothetical protein CVT26_007846 [Gymnopilus dilepis]
MDAMGAISITARSTLLSYKQICRIAQVCTAHSILQPPYEYCGGASLTALLSRWFVSLSISFSRTPASF